MTKTGYINEGKVKKQYEILKSKLNKSELSLIADFLAIEKCIMLKTVKLINMDMESILQ